MLLPRRVLFNLDPKKPRTEGVCGENYDSPALPGGTHLQIPAHDSLPEMHSSHSEKSKRDRRPSLCRAGRTATGSPVVTFRNSWYGLLVNLYSTIGELVCVMYL